MAELGAVNDHQSGAWLHLLVLADGCVIQHCGNLTAANVERDARKRYGRSLLVVVAVPSYERPLNEAEILKALAGTLPSPLIVPKLLGAWLVRVARLLGVQPIALLGCGHLEPHDIAGQAGSDALLVANLIRTAPTWINRPAKKYA
ncbi:hypothetical protein [Pseudomonas sp. GWSMS-1]|uniref:hypothetical protein n=1 Tax=Pseudomonas sp. GWSMS-1 TaxID=3308997 RepID=UPI003CE7F140